MFNDRNQEQNRPVIYLNNSDRTCIINNLMPHSAACYRTAILQGKREVNRSGKSQYADKKLGYQRLHRRLRPAPDSRRQWGTQKSLPTILGRPTAQHVKQHQSETETKALKSKQTWMHKENSFPRPNQSHQKTWKERTSRPPPRILRLTSPQV